MKGRTPANGGLIYWNLAAAGEIRSNRARLEITVGETLERAKGIEPSYAAWEAAVLPLNYARGCAPCAAPD
ncbi:protein of unknown function [Bradyrhizobium vignae]|uniref:Uncharacterized protein n=1 Tax=Bradyrhizobium vignae TaxID=1549949 RepID=A0A2U3QCN7_9BRAD|nr:protein of unknown function [Bradyrhizobium vignae]